MNDLNWSNVDEADIVINGIPLTAAESRTVRVALEAFSFDLEARGFGEVASAYREAVVNIRKAMAGSGAL